jgi:hypothetical protein
MLHGRAISQARLHANCGKKGNFYSGGYSFFCIAPGDVSYHDALSAKMKTRIGGGIEIRREIIYTYACGISCRKRRLRFANIDQRNTSVLD